MHDFTLEMEFNDFFSSLMKFCQFSKIIFRAAKAEVASNRQGGDECRPRGNLYSNVNISVCHFLFNKFLSLEILLIVRIQQ